MLSCLQPSPFSSAAFSILKITSMTAGDFSFNTILGFEEDGLVSFPAISYIVWLLFLIVMPILFSNLLVSEKDMSWSIILL
jgi:transient receptor potential cation channel subfamily A protein 1